MEKKIIDLTAPVKNVSFKRNLNPTYCQHLSIEVDEEERIVRCVKCNVVMSPFDYLRKIAYEDDNAVQRLVAKQEQVRKLDITKRNLEIEVERLKRQRELLR